MNGDEETDSFVIALFRFIYLFIDKNKLTRQNKIKKKILTNETVFIKIIVRQGFSLPNPISKI